MHVLVSIIKRRQERPHATRRVMEKYRTLSTPALIHAMLASIVRLVSTLIAHLVHWELGTMVVTLVVV